ncbi:MAG TPA: FHA domain-containing protein [Anaerolineales bacterium]|nr:FHA domain-containing protein [Anaerolineae bacterium]HIQ00874.1 FHA domain-containing protein [Anaerolineales bacterium]
MIECPSCGKKHRPGTLFCTECGVYLPTGGALRTEPLSTNELPKSRATSWEAVAPEGERAEMLQPLRIHILASDRQVQLPATPELLLGRLDTAHGIFPDLDLTADGGLEMGVSRRHAKIIQRGGEFFIEDVGSANGTFLNDQRLTPYLPYPLNEGDEIQIGRLRLRIVLE